VSAPRKSPASLDSIRDTVVRAIERTSLRQTAVDVGLTARGLSRFLAGAPPRASTVRKLREWSVRNAAKNEGASAETAAAALALLVEWLPAEQRDDAADALVSELERRAKAGGVAVPRWLASLRGGDEPS
jgi:hypothetical protein